MGAGALRDRVTFAMRVTADDGYGNTVGNWQDQFSRSAQITALRGGESVMAARLAGTQPVIIRVRIDSGTREITPGWKATHGLTGIAYNIVSVADMEGRRRYFDILARSGEALG
jgi:SPP1 family predicted phage head-tail adaptor